MKHFWERLSDDDQFVLILVGVMVVVLVIVLTLVGMANLADWLRR